MVFFFWSDFLEGFDGFRADVWFFDCSVVYFLGSVSLEGCGSFKAVDWFFGGGMGIMMLASLGLTEGTEDFHRLNAMKTLLSVVTAAVTLVVFSGGGIVSWPEGATMLAAVAAGGWMGVAAARRLPQLLVRIFVVSVGLLLTVYYAVV